ncbi:MAG: orotate phosphoribosyltransferase [Rhodospirillaceae bacterium]|nr:orotate phosphoribosyltransferase [Rhodospirillaceae bacterium]|tara:strand:+ start:1419 stop:1982 length:564 start_codon:yes stop_codon:yes gene_type:complete
MTSCTNIKEKLKNLVREKSLLCGANFTLASGETSQYYFNMKNTTFHPEGSLLLSDLILELLEPYRVDSIGGLEMGAVPIAAAVTCRSFQTDLPIAGFFVRKQTKGHGTKSLIEPNQPAGTKVAIIEDVTTTGASALQAVDALEAAGCKVSVIITLVDRQEGATEAFASRNLPFHALFSASDFDVSAA